MFCYQCEQTAKGIGCTVQGVCGKDPQTAALQDLLTYVAKGVSQQAHLLRQKGAATPDADVFVVEALFTTVTNVNFDPQRLATLIVRGGKILAAQKTQLGPDAGSLSGPATIGVESDLDALIGQGAQVGIMGRKEQFGDDVAGLQELLIYGLKGTAAYADHARILGHEDDAVYAFFHEALHLLATDCADIDTLLTYCLRCGEVNLRTMELLDAANTGAYGHPVPTKVRVTPVAGKAILISGHDLKDLEALLKQTEGKGINVYTHGEMLPCHGYPGLNKYEHLVGNYGGAWQDQQKGFAAFPGAILMTTNCIQKPREIYTDRIFTCGLVAWPDVPHMTDRNFQPVIDAALAAPGFDADAEEHLITVGFGHNAVLGVADKVIQAVKDGAIKHFFLIGGCDGAKSGRNYFTEMAQAVPGDAIILTLACGKYRFNKLEFGDIGGIPRLLDVGQCNDAYSAVKIAVALAEAFETDVNSLPLSMILSWYEQKAVCILLTLLHLGITKIKLGPTLPAFITPPVLNVLVEKFAIAPTTTAQQDLDEILAPQA